MAKLLLTAFALGLPSLDITAALLAVGALGAGPRSRPHGFRVFVYPRYYRVRYGPIAHSRSTNRRYRLGKILPHSPTEDRARRYRPGSGIADLWHRANTEAGHAPAKAWASRGLGLLSLAGAGVLFALAAIADPAFVSLVVIAGRADLFWLVLANT